MRNAKTRLLSLVLAVIMVVSMLPATALATDSVTPVENETPASAPSGIPENLAVSLIYGEKPYDFYVVEAPEGETVYANVEDAFDAAHDKFIDLGAGVGAAAVPEIHVYKDLAVTRLYGSSTTAAVIGGNGGKLLLDFHDNKVSHGTAAKKGSYGLIYGGYKNFDFTIQNATVDWYSSRYFLQTGTNSDSDRAGTALLKNVYYTGTRPMNYICKYDVILDGGEYKLATGAGFASAHKNGAGYSATWYLTGGVKVWTDAGSVAQLPAGADSHVYVDDAELYTGVNLDTEDRGYGFVKIYSTTSSGLVDTGLTGHITLGNKDGSVVSAFAELNTPATYNGKTVYKKLIKPAYDLTVDTAVVGGSITVEPNGKVAPGAEVTVTATPNEGFALDTILVNGNAIEGTTFTMPAEAVTVSAVFAELAANAYNITVAETENGTVTAPASAAVDEEVTLTIEPDAGYEVDTITVNGAAAEATFKMPAQAVEVVVTFKPANMVKVLEYIDANGTTPYNTADVADADYNTYTTTNAAFLAARDAWKASGTGTIKLYQEITVTSTGNPCITVGSGQSLVIDLNDQTLNYSPQAGSYRFTKLTGTNLETPAYLKIENGNVVDNGTGSGSFLRCNDTDTVGTAELININMTNPGNAIPIVPGGTKDLHIYLIGGEYHNLWAMTTAAGHAGQLYLDGDVKIYNNKTFLVSTTSTTSAGTLHVINAEIYTAGASTDIETGFGLLSEGTGTLDVPEGYAIKKSAEPVYDFDKDGTADLYKHTVEPLYNVTIDTLENGTVTVDSSAVLAGDTVVMDITPATGYEAGEVYVFNNNTGDMVEVIDNAFTMPDSDVLIYVEFTQLAANVFNITLNEVANGTVEVAANAAEGASVALTIEPAEGYELVSITVAKAEGTVEVVDNAFVMPAEPVTITVTFQVKIAGEPVVSYSDGTTTTDYYVAVADDAARNAYDSQQKAVEAAFAQWATVATPATAESETPVKGYGIITLHQNYDPTANIPAMRNEDGSSKVKESIPFVLDAGQHLEFNLNGFELEQAPTGAGRLFAFVNAATADTYLKVYGGGTISTGSTSAGSVVRIEGNTAAGTIEFENCTIKYTGSYAPFSIVASADLDLVLDGVTYVGNGGNGSAFRPTSSSSFEIHMQNGTKFYTPNATIASANFTGNLQLDDTVAIYTTSENLFTAGTVVVNDGMFVESVTTTEDLDFVDGEPTDGTLYKHTVKAIPENFHKVIIGEVVNGKVSAPEIVAEGTDVTLTVEAAKGYVLDTVFVDGVAIEGTTFPMPAADVTVTATFKLVLGEPVVSYFDGTTTINYYVAEVEDVNQNAYLSVEDAFEAAYDLWDLTGGVDAPATPEIHLHQDIEVTGCYDSSTSNVMQVGANSKLILDLEGHTLSTAKNLGGFYFNNSNTGASLTIQNGTVNWGTTNYRYFITGGASDENFESNSTITLKDLTFSSPTRPLSYLCNLNIILDGGTFNLGANAFNSIQNSDDGREGTGNVTLKNGVVINTTNSYAFRLPTDGHLYIEDAVIKTASNASTADEGYGIFVKVTSKTDATDLTSGLSNYVTLGNATNCSAVTTEAEGDAFKHTVALADAHVVVVDEAVAATCETDGLTEGTHCSVCNTVLVAQEVVKGGHAWGEPTYAWGEDAEGNATCTATRTCAADATHVETAEAVVTVEGDVTTAIFDVDWATTQTKGEVVVPTYTITWVVEGETVQTITDVEGTAVTAPEVEAREGYTFAWDQDITVIGTENVTVTGTYTEIPAATYTVTVNEATNGTVTADKTEVAEGETVTLTFAANSGYYLASLTVNGAEVQVTGNTATFTMPAGDVTVASVFKAQLAPSGTNMKLGASLKVQFAINVSKLYAADTNHYALVTKTAADGSTNTVRVDQADWTLYSGTTYLAGYTIAAREMGDIIEIMFYNSKNQPVVSDTKTQSAQLYAETLLNKSGTNAKTMNFLVDMLNYGAEAQKYFEYDLENLVNANLTEAQKALATSDADATPVNNQIKGTGSVGSTLGLQDVITLSFVFNNSAIGDIASARAVLTYTNYKGEAKEFEIPGTQFGKYSSTRSQVEFKELAVADYNTLVTCNIYDAEGTLVAYAADSMESYAARSIAAAQKVAPTAAAVVKFGVSSYKYLAG